jgi:hypothetical protein
VTRPTPSLTPRLRNRRTQALNRRESFWQIVLPLALAILVVLALMGLILVGTVTGSIAPARNSARGDVSLMFLILIAGAGSLMGLAILFGMNIGVQYALRELPYRFKQAQDFMALVAYHTKRVAAPLNESVLSVGSVVAAARQAVISVRSIFASGR